MAKIKEKPCGEFCEIFGVSPRSRILEHFLATHSLDFSIGDVAIETGLNRATTYNAMALLVKEQYLLSSRVVSGAHLYKLNREKEEVKVLLKAMDFVIAKIAKEYHNSEDQAIVAKANKKVRA